MHFNYGKLYEGLDELLHDPDLMEKHGITADNVIHASKSRFFDLDGGGLTKSDWVYYIQLLKRKKIFTESA